MKVTTDTPDLLIVDDRPFFVGILLIVFILAFAGVGLSMIASGEWWGAIFLILGGGMGMVAFWAFVRRVQVVFHRPQGYVEFRRRNLLRSRRERFGLDDIDRAAVEESRSSDSGSTWRVVLVIERGPDVGRHPVTFAYSNGPGHHRAADAINAWLDAARTGSTVQMRGET